ncbi:MAG: hypothetical protein JXA92_03295 [candidate division Zixibacteria bacterium]|nr:hypothetical protein [candidate division Zixibacteria bacterium]
MKITAIICIFAFYFFTSLTGCQQIESTKLSPALQSTSSPTTSQPGREKHPLIASWLAKKDEIIASRKPYDMVMSGWFTPEEAHQIKSHSPEARLLAGLTVNWVWNNPDWISFLTTVAGHGRETSFIITEDMYLKKPNGERCAFGWASKEWGHEEIYAIDPANPEWVGLVTSFYKNVLEQPQHDGIIIDMVLEKSLFPDAISDREWVDSTERIMAAIKEVNTTDKLVIFNAGRDFSEIDAYAEYMDGFLMENFLGKQLKTTFEDGLKAAETGFLVVYAVDTDDTGRQDMDRMRLGLTLSLLNNNTLFTYDFGPREHGQAWWFPEYDAGLGEPVGNYYLKDEAYYREFETGFVVASPNRETAIALDEEHIDVTSGERSRIFHIEKGDGRIYVKTE